MASQSSDADASAGIPDLGSLVARGGGEERPVGRKGTAEDSVSVAMRGMKVDASTGLPENDGRVAGS